MAIAVAIVLGELNEKFSIGCPNLLTLFKILSRKEMSYTSRELTPTLTMSKYYKR